MHVRLEVARLLTVLRVFVGQNAARVARAALRWWMLFSAIAIFLVLSSELLILRRVAVDGWIADSLFALRSDLLTSIMLVITELGSSRALIAVVTAGALLIGVLRHPRSALFLVVVGVAAALLNSALKVVFSRARPDVLLQLAHADGHSFPSGHSMGSAAVYSAIAIIVASRFPRYRTLAIASSLLVVVGVGLSRAYLFVHYPSDVLAGWALGVTLALWLKPALLGPGFRPATVPDAELVEDGVDPASVRDVAADPDDQPTGRGT